MRSEDCASIALGALKKNGVEAFEIFVLRKEALTACARDGVIESLSEAVEEGLAIRVLNGGGLGFSYTTSFEPSMLDAAVQAAIHSGRAVDADGSHGFAPMHTAVKFGWEAFDSSLALTPVAEKCAIALDLERLAKETSPKIKRVRSAEYEESSVFLRILNSNGVDLSFQKTMAGCDIVALAEDDGDSCWAHDLSFSHRFAGLDVEGTARRAAEQAVMLLGARIIPTTKTKACLHPFVATQFLRELGKAFQADNIYKHKSPLSEKLGKQLYPKYLNIIDDPLLEDGLGSYPFDGEGSEARRLSLVDSGTVANWLSDIYWAEKLSVANSGSAVRGSIKSLPSIGPANLFIEKGHSTREELLAGMDEGLFVTNIIGAHTINPVTGEFSVGAEGMWVENGKPLYPVKGIIIAGDLHDLFNKIEGIGNDLTFTGRTGSPTLLIKELQISGK